MGSVDDILCSIIQNGWKIELYLEEFLKYSHLSIVTDHQLMDLFWSGLDPYIAPWMPVSDSSFSLESYLDMVLLTCGSPFTVEVSSPGTQLKSVS